MNIANFMTWFLQQFVRVGTYMIGKLDEIKLIGQVSILDFIITIAIIGAFVGIIITTPQLGVLQREVNKQDRRMRREAMKQARKRRG